MKIHEFYKVFRRNWPVKLVCFVLAVFIYFFYRTATLQEKTLPISLEVSSQGVTLPTQTLPSHIKVSLKGRPEDLAGITEKNISALVNLDHYTEAGKYTVPVEILLAPEILGIEPLEVTADKSFLDITIAKKDRKQIPVAAEIQGTPASGYEIIDISIVPSTIGVSGAKSILDALEKVSTEAISVDEKRTSFSQKIPIHAESSLLSYNDAEVTVTVTIQPSTTSRRFVDQTIYLYGVNPLFEAQSDPERLTFTLTGKQNQLEAFVPELHTVRLDCSSLTEPGTYELPVEVVLPNGIRLVSQSSRTAQVSLVPFSEDESLENSVDEEATQATTEEVDKAKEEGEGEGSDTNDSAAPGEQSVQDATSLATDTSVPSDNTATPEAVVQEE
ncbi:MAG: CdaR family protein [Treponema sp.]|nr:CdaR family protein [Treponema sp.]